MALNSRFSISNPGGSSGFSDQLIKSFSISSLETQVIQLKNATDLDSTNQVGLMQFETIYTSSWRFAR